MPRPREPILIVEDHDSTSRLTGPDRHVEQPFRQCQVRRRRAALLAADQLHFEPLLIEPDHQLPEHVPLWVRGADDALESELIARDDAADV